MKDFSQKDRKFAVITGASSGIGKELAKLFAESKTDLLIAGRDEERLAAVAEELKSIGSEQVDLFLGDLCDVNVVRAMAARICDSGRGVDALCINAGRGLGGSFIGHTAIEEELEIIHLNVRSSVLLAKLVIPGMVERGEGKVLFTGSISGTTPVPYEAVYGASKAFINSFAHALNFELRDSGVGISVLMPEATDTDFFHHAHMDDTRVGSGKKQDPAVVAKNGYEAMMSGRESVFGGNLQAKVKGRLLNAVLPDKLKEKMAGHRSEPGGATR